MHFALALNSVIPSGARSLREVEEPAVCRQRL